jgi:cold shock CspA family protein
MAIGVVKWFDDPKGFGCIEQEDGPKEFYPSFHRPYRGKPNR